MKVERIETDVLCVGGGIAGLMAAIRARDLGAEVVVAEKSNTSRSGAGGMGCDHFGTYIPEVHGSDIDSLAHEMANSRLYGYMMRPDKFYRTRLEKSLEITKLWDSWGIPMKYKGNWEFTGGMALKYSGQNQKPVLTKEALKKGVEILNRVMIFDLLCKDGIAGAVGIHTREDKIIEFRAKSVILGTGKCVRMYPGPTPGWMFNIETCPVTSGDGRAMAYRAGAELANMESILRWAGVKYFSRCGKGTWVGVLRNPEGNPVGPFVTKPYRYLHGDPIADIYPSIFDDYNKTGEGPVYMSNKHISDEDLEYQNYWLHHEGNSALLKHLEEEGIDTRESGVEFMTYELETWGGIPYNEKGETSLKGLYAAGDEYGDQSSQAAIFGWIAGENAAKSAQENPVVADSGGTKAETEQKNTFIDKIRNREDGATWQEVNIALQQVMFDYAGAVRSESILKAGLRHLRRLKKKAHETMMAKNQHELMHCLEVINLIDLGELVFVAALERKETRDSYVGVRSHVRADYPYTNPQMEKVLICKMKNGNPTTEWREREK